MKDLRHRAPEMLRAAKAAGLATSIDTQWDHEGLWMKSLEPCLPHTDLLFVNEDEGRELTGYCSPPEIARHLRGLGAGEVVVKLGAKGCFVSGFSMPALPVSVVDTTGAGDCFVGGYLAALHRGMNHREAAAVANRVGALAVQKLGASSAMEELFPTEFWAE
jgi:sugar/nucleoside kinase (ribokinase family)